MKLTNHDQGRIREGNPYGSERSLSPEPQSDSLPHLSLKQSASDRPPSRPLSAHKIHIQKVNTGLKGFFGRGLRAILTPIINQVIESSYNARTKVLEQTCQYSQAKMGAASERLTRVRKQLEETDKAVSQRLKLISDGEPVPQNELRHLLAERDTKVRSIANHQAHLDYYSKSLAEAESKLKAHKKTGRTVTNTLKGNTDSLVKLATDLRSAYNANKNKTSQPTAYQITLPRIDMMGEDFEPITLQNLNLVIDSMGLSESGDFTLNLLSVSVQASTTVDGTGKPPVNFQGCCKLVIKAPLGKHFENMLSCGVHEVIGKAGLFSEALETALHKAESDPSSPLNLSELVSVEVSDIGISTEGQTHGLLTQQATDVLLKTFSPVMGVIKLKSDKGTIERLESENTVSRQCIQSYEDRENSLRCINLKVHQCLDRIHSQSITTDEALIEQLRVYSASCEHQLHIFESQITHEKTKLQNKTRLLKHYRRRLKASKSTTEATIKNGATGLMALREVVIHRDSPTKSIKLTPDRQSVSLSDTADANLQNCKVHLKNVTLDSAGELHIQLNGASAQVDIHSAQKRNTPLGTLWMKDITINIHPPLGTVLHEMLTLSPPFSLQEIENLYEQYHKLTTGDQSFTDYLDIHIGQAGRQKPVDEIGPEEEANRPLSSIPDLDLADWQIKNVLMHMLHLDQSSCSQVMDMLALSPQQETPEPDDNEEDEFFDAVETLEDSPVETSEEDVYYDALDSLELPATPAEPPTPPQPSIRPEDTEESLSPLSALAKFGNIRQILSPNAHSKNFEASFLLVTDASPVMGKASRFFLWLLGSPQIHWQVSCPISGEEPDIERARIRPASSNGNFLWIMLEKRFMRAALKKRILSLQPQRVHDGAHIMQLVPLQD